jgi:hypothetical protein
MYQVYQYRQVHAASLDKKKLNRIVVCAAPQRHAGRERILMTRAGTWYTSTMSTTIVIL